MAKNDRRNYTQEDIALLLSDKPDKSVAKLLKRTLGAVIQKRMKLLSMKKLPPPTTPQEELPAVRMAAKRQDDPLKDQILVRVGGRIITAERDGLDVVSISENSVLLQYSMDE